MAEWATPIPVVLCPFGAAWVSFGVLKGRIVGVLDSFADGMQGCLLRMTGADGAQGLLLRMTCGDGALQPLLRMTCGDGMQGFLLRMTSEQKKPPFRAVFKYLNRCFY